MRLLAIIAIVPACVLASGAVARADRAGEGYCDWVEGVADSESALLLSPTLFASLGYLDQGVVVTVPDASGRDVRLTAGVSYELTGVLEGFAVRNRARAECGRHRALGRLERATVHGALRARAAVLDEALDRADEILREAGQDLRQRRATAQDVTATRIRVDALRASASQTRAELAALGASGGGEEGKGAVRAYFDADDEVARQEARIRRTRAFDLSVRFGYDAFTGPIDDDESPLFGVVAVGINIGALFQGGAEDRAASGRRRFMREERSAQGEPTLRHLRVLAREARQREEQVGILVADLEKQLASLDEIGGDTGKRYRETVWFELVEAKAEHAYLRAQGEGLADLMGEGDE